LGMLLQLPEMLGKAEYTVLTKNNSFWVILPVGHWQGKSFKTSSPAQQQQHRKRRKRFF